MGAAAVLADHIPNEDAIVVSRLAEAGAVLLGKLNLTEGAMGGYNPQFEAPLNPWNPGVWSRASSSGSGIATAAGLAYGTLGSDTGGSIRDHYPCNNLALFCCSGVGPQQQTETVREKLKIEPRMWLKTGFLIPKWTV